MKFPMFKYLITKHNLINVKTSFLHATFFTMKMKKQLKNQGVAPLARASNASSCMSSGHTPPQGYCTPIDGDDDSDDDLIDERRDYVDDDPPPLTPRASSLLQAPSPNSAILTVSLDGYLEPTRISFGSPPNSELNPRGVSPDETFPVFSPPPYDALPHNINNCNDNNNDRSCRSTSIRGHRRQSSYGATTWMSDIPTTPRQSIVSFTSRSPRSHHTCNNLPWNISPASTYHVYKLSQQ